jgi:putative peptide zinc metalloprotease protein
MPTDPDPPPSAWQPELAPGVEIRQFNGSCLLAAPQGRAYLQLDADAPTWLTALDGTTSTVHLTERFGGHLPALLTELREGGFLVDSPPAPPARRVVLTRHGLEFAGAERLVRLLHPLGRPLLTRTGLLLIAVLGVLGIALWAGGALPQPLARTTPTAATAVIIVALDFGLVVIHELAHALVLEHYGRHIGRVGIGTYWGGLSFYVDASAALLLPRRARLLQAAAGILADAAVIGVLAATASLLDPRPAAILSQAVVLALLNILLNSTPLLELDGYWILTDALQQPDLHRRARAALTDVATGNRTPTRLLLAGYALTGLLLGVLLLTAAVLLWIHVFWPLLSALWAAGIGSKILAAWLALPLLAPLIIDLTTTATRLLRGNERESSAS